MSTETAGAARGPRLPELQRLNVLFCLLVVFIHCASQPVTVLDHRSRQYAAVLICQWLSFVSVPGFFLLAGVKLALPATRPRSFPAYWRRRARTIFLPYLLAAAVYYLYFVAEGYFPASAREFAGYVLRGDLAAHFYFLIALLQFIVLAPLLLRLTDRYPPRLLLPPALLITWLTLLFFNRAIQALAPGAWLTANRSFASYLFYYLGGCCIGARYEDFPAFLAKYRRWIYTLAAAFAAADAALGLLHYSGRRAIAFLPVIHSLYISFALLALFDLALRRKEPIAPLTEQLDAVSFPVYLYHVLTIFVFDRCAAAMGVTGIGVLFLLRLIAVYTVTIGLCLLWRRVVKVGL